MRQRFQFCDSQKILYIFRRFPEAVGQLLRHVLILFLIFNRRNSLIGVKLQSLVADVAVRNIGTDIQINRCLEHFCRCDALRLFNRLCEHFTIEIVSNRFHMARLLRAQQISGATDLKVTHCNFKTTSHLRKFTNRMETLLRHFLQHLVSAVHQKRIRRPVRPSDAAAELIEL